MQLLDNDHLQRLVDYSFGDHSGVLGGVPQAFMKKANIDNSEFVEAVNAHDDTSPMTLFIDNIRLYRRPIEYSDWLHMKPVSPQDRKWLDQFEDEDLLSLCAAFPERTFVIFTAFEDTPLDHHIGGRVPENVLAIHAANAVVFGDKIIPWPHGLERKLTHMHNNQDILEHYADLHVEPTKLLYVNHREDTGNRGNIRDLFRDKPWALVSERQPYEPYVQGIQSCKFVLCPSGNGIESARNWETLYLNRVPVFKDHPYLREVFRDFPALFVKDFSEVTEELLIANEYLYDQEFDWNQLDLVEQFNKRKNG